MTWLLWLFHAEGALWGLGDLHTGNIRRLPGGIPVIIDAHMGVIPPGLPRHVPSLARGAGLAKARAGLLTSFSG